MDWQTIATGVATTIFVAGFPYGLYLAQQWSNAHIKNAQMKQWADGVMSAAGRGYVAIVAARQASPTTPLVALVRDEAKRQGQQLMLDYAENADKLGATQADAQSRVTGALGVMLAADPTVSVAAKTPGVAAVA